MPILHAATYSLIALVLLTGIGNILCRYVFSISGLGNTRLEPRDDLPPAGWLIGWLERIVLAIGIIGQSWELLAAVIALKTVARFKDLDEKGFAEYFLVGSLFSVIWAISITHAWIAYDSFLGQDLRSKFIDIIVQVDEPYSGCLAFCMSGSMTIESITDDGYFEQLR